MAHALRNVRIEISGWRTIGWKSQIDAVDAIGDYSIIIRDVEKVREYLHNKGICISTGSACDSSRTQISHVLQAMDIPDNYAKGTIRISLGEENTHDDVVTIARALSSILRKQTKS